jgi:hypothetical protein
MASSWASASRSELEELRLLSQIPPSSSHLPSPQSVASSLSLPTPASLPSLNSILSRADRHTDFQLKYKQSLDWLNEIVLSEKVFAMPSSKGDMAKHSIEGMLEKAIQAATTARHAAENELERLKTNLRAKKNTSPNKKNQLSNLQDNRSPGYINNHFISTHSSSRQSLCLLLSRTFFILFYFIIFHLCNFNCSIQFTA